jgi:hypothetical protein
MKPLVLRCSRRPATLWTCEEQWVLKILISSKKCLSAESEPAETSDIASGLSPISRGVEATHRDASMLILLAKGSNNNTHSRRFVAKKEGIVLHQNIDFCEVFVVPRTF